MSTYTPMLTLEEGVWAWVYAGARKAALPLHVRFLKAFLGGLFLSFGGLLVQILQNDPLFTQTNAPGLPGLLKILQGLVFPVGLVMIVLFQADLVTASQAIFVMATLKRKVPPYAFLIDWLICLTGNLAGALLWGGLVTGSRVLSQAPAFEAGAAAIVNTKLAEPFGVILLRGIGCNLLVCIAVFQASLMRDGISKIVAAHFPIFVFVAAGFDHVVANFYLIPSGLMTHLASLQYGAGTYVWKSAVSSFLGNLIGAAILAVPLLLIHAAPQFDPHAPNEHAPHGSAATTTVTVSAEGQNKHAGWEKDIEAGTHTP